MEVLTGDLDRLLELRGRVSNRFIKMLRRSADRGFLGGMPISDQVDHALGFVFALETVLKGQPVSVLDLGSGGGLPGLVLIAAWPDSKFVLLDANERRTEFLQAEAQSLPSPENVEVLRGRAEELGRDVKLREKFDVVVSRSFGSPAATAECGSAFVRLGGTLAISEPPEPEGERWPNHGIKQFGFNRGDHVRFVNRFGYQVLTKVEQLSPKFPRRVGVPTKRPAF